MRARACTSGPPRRPERTSTPSLALTLTLTPTLTLTLIPTLTLTLTPTLTLTLTLTLTRPGAPREVSRAEYATALDRTSTPSACNPMRSSLQPYAIQVRERARSDLRARAVRAACQRHVGRGARLVLGLRRKAGLLAGTGT